LAGETEALGENLPQCRFVHHKPHMMPVREPGPPRWEASVCPLELRHGLEEHLEITISLNMRVLNVDSSGTTAGLTDHVKALNWDDIH
jgi:hypothetical protein